MVDDDKKEKQQACLRAFNHYFPQHDRESGCIKQIKEELEKNKQINDLEEKYQKANFCWSKHKENEAYTRSKYNNGKLSELGISKLDTIEKYHKLVKELWNLKVEITKKLESKKVEQNKLEREREREREQLRTI